MNNEDENPVSVIESALVETATRSGSAANSDSPRDTWWLRWIKFASVIIVPALILGVGFLFEDYFEQDHAQSSYNRNVARRHVEHDTVMAMTFRFWIGACVGGGLGAIYVARCIVRKTDP